jgi:hypothetical protein
MVFGELTQETLSVLDALGIEPDDLEWQDLAVCHGLDVKRFYEGYETSVRTAKLTDQICLSCPVRKECLAAGVENGEWGVWGGVYLTSGKADDKGKNDHKTPEIWKQIREGIE